MQSNFFNLRLTMQKKNNKNGLVTVVGSQKFHFMSDTKWLLRQGFVTVEKTCSGFSLLLYKINENAENPRFNESVKSGECKEKNGITVYFSHRCPFAEFHVKNSLTKTAEKRKFPLNIIKIENIEQAQNSPSPATIFSLFFNGKFVTTDLSSCLDSKFDKIIKKIK